jgi:hypothetical protein
MRVEGSVTKKAGLFAELANVVWSAIEEVELFEGPAVKVADVAVEQVEILEQGADVVGFAVERAASTQLSSPLSAFVAGAPAGAWFMAEYLGSWQGRRCVARGARNYSARGLMMSPWSIFSLIGSKLA